MHHLWIFLSLTILYVQYKYKYVISIIYSYFSLVSTNINMMSTGQHSRQHSKQKRYHTESRRISCLLRNFKIVSYIVLNLKKFSGPLTIILKVPWVIMEPIWDSQFILKQVRYGTFFVFSDVRSFFSFRDIFQWILRSRKRVQRMNVHKFMRSNWNY